MCSNLLNFCYFIYFTMGASSPQKLSKGKQQQTNQYQNLRVDFDIELFTLAFPLFVRGFLSLFVQPLFFFSLLC